MANEQTGDDALLKGSCLCGAIAYEYHGSITEVAVCHCTQCKRAQGAAFATNAPLEQAKFSFIQGEAALKSYYSSPNKRRTFCRHCGSPIFSQRTDLPDIIRLRLGTVTEGEIPEPDYQMFCESASAWRVLDEAKPQYPHNKA